ncbi:MAG: hypothetical protein IKM39_00545 [Clostridia bacterium]|nr:hypothetical protein [Clostridia bacterium]
MKRFCMVLLSAIMVFVNVLCPLGALADTNLTLGATTVSAKPGEQVKVSIFTDNNPGVISIKVKIHYDSSVLVLEKIEGKDFPQTSFSPIGNNPVTVNWIDSLHPNNTTNGTLAVLTMRVLEDASAGNSSITLSCDPNDIFDFDYHNVPVTTVVGGVAVEGDNPGNADEPSNPGNPSQPGNPDNSGQPGDPSVPNLPVDPNTPTDSDKVTLGNLNEDNKIDAKDALIILRIAVQKHEPTKEQTIAGDVNQDGSVNAKDALEILKHAVGKPSCLE